MVLGMRSQGQNINPLGVNASAKKSELAMKIAREILKRDGLQGFYRGYTASLLAYVPNSALWWGFYHFYQGLLISLFHSKLHNKIIYK